MCWDRRHAITGARNRTSIEFKSRLRVVHINILISQITRLIDRRIVPRLIFYIMMKIRKILEIFEKLHYRGLSFFFFFLL